MRFAVKPLSHRSHSGLRLAAMPPPSQPRFVRRLGLHHFAHLRAVAEGLPVLDSARRYLGIDHGHQATTAHQQTVDAVRTVAHRHAGMGDWRLIGLRITLTPAGAAPTLEDFMLEQGVGSPSICHF